MPKRLTAKSMSLPELLLSGAAFMLPPSQRVYGWGELQMDGLFRDIKADSFASGVPGEAQKDHWFFFGTVYLADDAEKGQTYIADGQQRVVTGTMLFAVARDLATNEDDRAHFAKYVAAPEGYRLSLRDVDAAFFRKWVQEPGATLIPYEPETDDTVDSSGAVVPLSESQNNILVNRNRIVEQLKPLGATGRRRLLDHLNDCSELVVITAKKLEDATAAYASTYKRGLSQATTDRLKSECLGDADPERRAILGNHWDECEARLGKEGLEDLLYLMTIDRTRSATLTDLQSEVLKQFNLPADVSTFIETQLVPAAEAYHLVIDRDARLEKRLDPGYFIGRRARAIADHLIVLRRTSHIEWRLPAFLAVTTLQADHALLETTLQRLERLAAAHMIVGVDPQVMVNKYATLADAIRSRDANAIQQASEVDRAIVAKIKPALQSSSFATKARLRMPVLLKINDLMAKSVVPLDTSEVSCEHVLPQNVPKEYAIWHQKFRTSDGKRYNGAVYRHRLGNLTILEHHLNREAGSRPFDEKKSIIGRSTHAIARECAKYADWNADMVDGRTERLTAMLLKHWDF